MPPIAAATQSAFSTSSAILASDTRTRSFRPGDIWADTGGRPINAHGAGFLHHEGTTYWYGEHKIAGEAGNAAHVGVHAYASDNLLEAIDGHYVWLPIRFRHGTPIIGWHAERSLDSFD